MKGTTGKQGRAESSRVPDRRYTRKQLDSEPPGGRELHSLTATSRSISIVGIGASAGGLQAFATLLAALPAKTGMAFVLVRHLDPARENTPPEIPINKTRIPTCEVTDGMTVEPDRIYVSPGNAIVELEDGALRLSARPRAHEFPIDHFFRSLAEECGQKAIGVILSGAVFDGTEGCYAIKSAGGITIAQDAESAQYDSMPSSAVSAGCVDLVLPPEAMARKLAKLARDSNIFQSPGRGRGAPGLIGHQQLRRLFSMLLDTTGVDFTHYKRDTLLRRLQRRMALRRIRTVGEYLRYAQSAPGELKDLHRDLLIQVTGFFRGPEMFAAFDRHVAPDLLKKRKKGEPLRVWVAGCSTGEEAYSYAIALLEALGRPRGAVTSKAPGPAARRVQIFATDISEPALARARSGFYPEGDVERLGSERVERFFVRSNAGFQVSKAVREMCIFAKHNITRDPPFLNLDLVSCRNLLIYLSPALQHRIIATLQYALKPDGYLILGESESLGPLADRFAVVEKKQRIYRKLARAPVALPFPGIATAGPAVHRAKKASAGDAERTVADEVDQALMKQFLPASIVVSPQMEIVQFRGKTGPYLEPASGRAAFSLWKMVNQSLIPDLRIAINEAAKHNRNARRADVLMRSPHGRLREIDLEVIPLPAQTGEQQRYVIVFQEKRSRAAAKAGTVRQVHRSKRTSGAESESERLMGEVEHLRGNLQSLTEVHDQTLEEYNAANEAVVSANEELQSTNQELESAKEELQAANEELSMLNDELRARNVDLSEANADLTNLLVNVKIPLMMVDRELSIRLFTPPAEKLLNLLPIGAGQKLHEVRPNLEMDDLAPGVRDVIDEGGFREREVQERGGPWHLMRVRPYKAPDGSVNGAVITFQNIDALKRTLDQTRHYADALIENAREPLLILDAGLRVAIANKAFYRKFKLTREETESRLIYELDNGQWDIPRLRDLLMNLLSASQTEEDFELRHDFAKIGMRILLLNARRIEPESAAPLILLAIEDVTERTRALAALKRQATMFDLVHDAIILRDLDGIIRFWSHGAERMYGWTEREALGQVTRHLLHTSYPVALEEIEREVTQTGRWEGEFVQTRRDGSRIVVHSHWGFQPGSDFAPPGMLQVNSDITGLKESEGSLRVLSRALIRAQDSERQRIARELHDSTGQKLVALKMQLNAAVQRRPDPNGVRILNECLGLSDQVMRDVRTLAYSLYPPMLEEAGLASAIRWFVEVFSRQTGLTVQLFVPPRFRRLPKEAEIALFRVAQESLTNVLQHSGSRQASIALRLDGASEVRLEVEDKGNGNPELRAGLGIMGMKERMRQTGGRLDVASGPGGTVVKAILPLANLSQAAGESPKGLPQEDGNGFVPSVRKRGPEAETQEEIPRRESEQAIAVAKPNRKGTDTRR